MVRFASIVKLGGTTSSGQSPATQTRISVLTGIESCIELSVPKSVSRITRVSSLFRGVVSVESSLTKLQSTPPAKTRFTDWEAIGISE